MSRALFPFLSLALIAGAAGGAPGPDALPLPFDSTVVVTGREVTVGFALKELNCIVRMATGQEFGQSRPQPRPRPQPCHRIFLGRSPEAEKILGTDFFESLADEESAVMARDGDLFLVGGGEIGCLWAVYDFLEDNLGFRQYFKDEDGFVVEKSDGIVWKGVPSRRRPPVRGYRAASSYWAPSETLSHVRNRSNTAARKLIPGYRFAWQQNIGGHGFLFYIPAEDPKPKNGWRPKEVRGMFETHPEYFSLGEDGRRHPDMQLCLSNPACRRHLTQMMLAYVRARGKGLYMLGSNDNHNTRYCWCDGCRTLEEKYDSVGGPLWDYILELCAELKARHLDGVYVHSLAYKGPNQTERAPKGIARFPDNFICDAAFLNSDRPLRDVPDEPLGDGTVFNRLENLRRWRGLVSHLTYWYYGGANPAQVGRRMSEEMRELREAGVEAIFACGTGGAVEFGDFTPYLFYWMIRHPDGDWRVERAKVLAVRYGPAAKAVEDYIDALEEVQHAATKKLRVTTGCDDPYGAFSFLEGADLLRLRKLSDRALALAKDTPYALKTRESRLGLDIWTLSFFHKIRQADPKAAAQIDCRAVRDEAHAIVAGLKTKSAYLLRAVDEMANYANLKNDDLPAELARYPREKVFRILPPARAPHICGNVVPGVYTCEADPGAASGWAWTDLIREKCDLSKGVGVEIYSDSERTWLWRSNQNPIPLENFKKGEYTLWRLCETRLPSRVCLVFAGNWGGPTSTSALSRLFDPSYQNRQWEIWISSRGEGPKFFADEEPSRPSRLWIDQIFCVDKGVPEGK